jgi:Protein of unknown function (DUF1214)
MDVPGRVALSSTDEGVVKNPDGLVDVYFGHKAPQGHESNWVQTVPDKRWFIMFRFYGTQPAVYDKSWRMGGHRNTELRAEALRASGNIAHSMSGQMRAKTTIDSVSARAKRGNCSGTVTDSIGLWCARGASSIRKKGGSLR